MAKAKAARMLLQENVEWITYALEKVPRSTMTLEGPREVTEVMMKQEAQASTGILPAVWIRNREETSAEKENSTVRDVLRVLLGKGLYSEGETPARTESTDIYGATPPILAPAMRPEDVPLPTVEDREMTEAPEPTGNIGTPASGATFSILEVLIVHGIDMITAGRQPKEALEQTVQETTRVIGERAETCDEEELRALKAHGEKL
ncbi:hypothetical protein B0H67DRAFT_647509 [Lasiosphaeris hirsuta]|uniref:Uncharacterized protein n=1 Tax=Lasiosphaeris hirsuta TaxID=260670 RepID=A0AA40DKR7_9PEZI|nr:hypothetical protein B0H67DRAFT_647509 [Lasiosphaeris hirsuta]